MAQTQYIKQHEPSILWDHLEMPIVTVRDFKNNQREVLKEIEEMGIPVAVTKFNSPIGIYVPLSQDALNNQLNFFEEAALKMQHSGASMETQAEVSLMKILLQSAIGGSAIPPQLKADVAHLSNKYREKFLQALVNLINEYEKEQKK